MGLSGVQRERWGYVGAASVILAGLGYYGAHSLRPAAAPPLQVHFGNSTAPVSANARIVCHVTGAVKKPGVYELASGARVQDAVAAAGGALPNADIEAVNLAAFAADGQQILVPKKEDAVTSPASVSRSPGKANSHKSRGHGHRKEPPPLHSISLNHAGADELTRIPGIGPATAEKIIQYRAGIGGFKYIDELRNVKGMGAKKLESIRQYFKLP
ncbi:MAG: helix-hairpin-helix domain-containing protein [Armatimonadetes bacterium]|nr:helix-hairpin-helix domain-containing protein [Armatimonadota bacterium]